MNGDGAADLLISSPGAGKVYLLHANTPSGSVEQADWYWQSSNVESLFGNNIVSLGDIDADGLSEAMVGAPDFSGSGNYSGAVFLLDDTDINNTQDVTELNAVYGAHSWHRFGKSTDPIGDADGDGIDDILISAGGNYGGHNSGTTYLIGSDTIFSSSFSLENAVYFYGHDVQAKAGTLVRGVGDFNGDGYRDFSIRSVDRYQLIYGKADFTLENSLVSADVILMSSAAWFAHRISDAGDLNSDGFDDFLVSHAQAGLTGTYAKNGLVLGFLGSSTLTGTYADEEAADFLISGNSGQRLGMALAPAGDIEGDGYDDVWIGMGTCSVWSQCDTPLAGDVTLLLSGIALE